MNAAKARVGTRRGHPQGWAGSSGGRAQRATGGAILLLATLLACSPEATRTRGSGPGADVGNHGQPMEIHGRTNPSHDTPPVGQAIRK